MRDATVSTALSARVRDTAVLRAVLFVDAVVFISAALFNEGVKVPLGFTSLGFPRPVWQAGIGEAVIGLALLAGSMTGSVALSWVALWMSVIGIAFGLSSPAVQGPAREIHVLLIPLAIVVFGLLVWQRQHENRLRAEAVATGGAGVGMPQEAVTWQRISIAICVLMVLAAVSFAAASLIHFGAVIVLGPITIVDPFAGAALPEAIIAVSLAAGSVGVIIRRSAGWALALATTLFALLLTIFGLTVTLRTARTGDIVYHVTILAALTVIAVLLLLPAGRRSLGRSHNR